MRRIQTAAASSSRPPESNSDDSDSASSVSRPSTNPTPPPDSPVPQRTALQGPRPRGAIRKILDVASMAGVGYLAFAATVRHQTSDGRFVQDALHDPVSLLAAMLRLEPRASGQTLEHARHQVVGQFGAYIAPESPCFNASAEVTTEGPAPGHYDAEQNRVLIAPNHFAGAHATAVHEWIHCFSHGDFWQTVTQGLPFRSANALNEGVTQHLTRQVPIPPNESYLSGYDLVPVEGLSGTPVDAARAIVKAMGSDGEETLKKAFFAGDAEALQKLDDAMFNVLPRGVTPRAWDALANIHGPIPKRRPEKLAEMFLGSVLLHTPHIFSGLVQHGMRDMSAAQRRQLLDWMEQYQKDDPNRLNDALENLRVQTRELREKVGPDRFDTAFCRSNVEPKARRKLMIELADQWQLALPKEFVIHALALKLS